MSRSPSLDALKSMRAASGPAWTKGLADDAVERFAACDPRLARAIEAAVEQRASLRSRRTASSSGWRRGTSAGYSSAHPELLPGAQHQPVRAARRRRGRGSSPRTARSCTTREATGCSASAMRPRRCSTRFASRTHGERHDALVQPVPAHGAADARDRPQPRRMPVRQVRLPQQRFGGGDLRLPCGGHSCAADDGSRRAGMPAGR